MPKPPEAKGLSLTGAYCQLAVPKLLQVCCQNSLPLPAGFGEVRDSRWEQSPVCWV